MFICTWNFKQVVLVKVPLHSEKYVLLLVPTVECLSFAVQSDVICCKWSSSELIENMILWGGTTSMICDITHSFEAIHGPVFNLHSSDRGTLKPPVHKH